MRTAGSGQRKSGSSLTATNCCGPPGENLKRVHRRTGYGCFERGQTSAAGGGQSRGLWCVSGSLFPCKHTSSSRETPPVCPYATCRAPHLLRRQRVLPENRFDGLDRANTFLGVTGGSGSGFSILEDGSTPGPGGFRCFFLDRFLRHRARRGQDVGECLRRKEDGMWMTSVSKRGKLMLSTLRTRLREGVGSARAYNILCPRE